jgi:tetratricopeptide (TPR) repeat protein
MQLMATRRIFMVVICASIGFSAPGYAQEGASSVLSEAAEAYGILDYELCVDSADQAAKMPATRQERLDAYRYLGLCHAALGDTESARQYFVRLLAIDPNSKLPDGLSPRFTSTFLEAKGYWLGREALAMELQGESKDGALRLLEIALIDSEGLIDKVAWRARDGETAPFIKAAQKMEVEVPADVAYQLVAFDEFEGEIYILPIMADDVPAQNGDADAASGNEASEPEGSFFSSPILWAGVGTVVAAVLLGGGAAVGSALYFYEPDSVTLKSSVDTTGGGD